MEARQTARMWAAHHEQTWPATFLISCFQDSSPPTTAASQVPPAAQLLVSIRGSRREDAVTLIEALRPSQSLLTSAATSWWEDGARGRLRAVAGQSWESRQRRRVCAAACFRYGRTSTR